jgi:hypothetical protein
VQAADVMSASIARGRHIVAADLCSRAGVSTKQS